jgi:hypothetical protein
MLFVVGTVFATIPMLARSAARSRRWHVLRHTTDAGLFCARLQK